MTAHEGDTVPVVQHSMDDLSENKNSTKRYTDQGNAESASTAKLKVLGTVQGVPYKRLEALSVLTLDPTRVETQRIAAEYSFSSLTCSVLRR